jgi:hypothetical protein
MAAKLLLLIKNTCNIKAVEKHFFLNFFQTDFIMEPSTAVNNYETLVAEADGVNEVLEIMQSTFNTPTDSENMIFNKDYYKPKIV